MIRLLFVALAVMIASSVYDFKVEGLEGGTIDLSQYKGKKILIVNTASKCGFTPQYKDLEALYEQYKDKLVVIGFPANNFMRQEPGTNAEIKEFCEKVGLTPSHLFFYGKAWDFKDLKHSITSDEEWRRSFIEELENDYNNKKCNKR